MKDLKNQSLIDRLHPAIRQRVIDFIDAVEAQTGLKIRITSGLRSFEEQQAIYDQGRTKPGDIVSWAKPGSSYHNYGLAVDLWPWKPDYSDINWQYEGFSEWKPLAQKFGLSWGGDFPKGKTDPPHYQWTNNLHWSDLLKRYKKREFLPGTEFVKLD